MAKSNKGLMGAFRGLWRMTVLGLAVILLLAIYINISSDDELDVADVAPTVEAPVIEPAETTAAETTEETETAVDAATSDATEAATEASEAAETAIAEATAAAETALSEAEEAASESLEGAREGVEEGIARVTDALEGAADRISGAAEGAGDAVQADTADPVSVGEAATDIATGLADDAGDAAAEAVSALAGPITVPGDDTTYELVNAFKRDDGAIEFSVEQTGPDGLTQTVTRLVTCAPFAVGVIAEGDGARIDQPDLERIPLGSAEATLAAMACGAFR